MTRKLFLAVTLLAASGAAAYGDSLSLTGATGFSPDTGGSILGTLTPPGTEFTLWCVDYLNGASVGQTFDVNVSKPISAANITNARYGTTPAANFANNLGGSYDALARYLMSGWLITQFNIPLGQNDAFNVGNQDAIWNILSVTGQPASQNDSLQTTARITAAVSWYNSQNAGQLVTFGNSLRIVTDAVVGTLATTNGRYNSGHQEFMIVGIPEPGTYALMGLGMVGLGLLRRRLKA